jgi:hypothetical protein
MFLSINREVYWTYRKTKENLFPIIESPVSPDGTPYGGASKIDGIKKASAWRTQRPTRKETYTTPPQVWYKAFNSSESIVSRPFEFLLFPVCYT